MAAESRQLSMYKRRYHLTQKSIINAKNRRELVLLPLSGEHRIRNSPVKPPLLYVLYRYTGKSKKFLTFFNSPAELSRSTVMSTYVCLSVCLSAKISPEPHARSSTFLRMLSMGVARSSCSRVTKFQGQ